MLYIKKQNIIIILINETSIDINCVTIIVSENFETDREYLDMFANVRKRFWMFANVYDCFLNDFEMFGYIRECLQIFVNDHKHSGIFRKVCKC